MVFGLIGGLRHLMWFVHASEPANLKILFQSEMQALHGSLNFCARDCGNRCRCEHVYARLKPKPLQTHHCIDSGNDFEYPSNCTNL